MSKKFNERAPIAELILDSKIKNILKDNGYLYLDQIEHKKETLAHIPGIGNLSVKRIFRAIALYHQPPEPMLLSKHKKIQPSTTLKIVPQYLKPPKDRIDIPMSINKFKLPIENKEIITLHFQEVKNLDIANQIGKSQRFINNQLKKIKTQYMQISSISLMLHIYNQQVA